MEGREGEGELTFLACVHVLLDALNLHRTLLCLRCEIEACLRDLPERILHSAKALYLGY